MPLQLRDLRALEGPNIYYPQPAVKLQLWADRDLRVAVSDAVKQWSQQVGVVIGALRQDVEPQNDGFLITTTWTTPLPNTGERIAEGAWADLQAADSSDEDYSHDDALFAAIDARKREEPSLAQLQLYAEAQVRDLPLLPRGDGTLMIGTGARGQIVDPSVFSLGMSVSVDWERAGTIPVVAVTGTNGKTTTVRLIAHIVDSAGQRVGRTDTDGVVINGATVEEGDWAGFGGARRVLTDPQVDVAVLETSRGGILRRGLGFASCDVSVLTNISADHLGEFGIETLEQMAEVKGLIVLVTKPDGYTVLNADDRLVVQLRAWSDAPVVLWSRDPANQIVAEHIAQGGAAVRSDGNLIEAIFKGERHTLPLSDVPITFGGAALHNVENVLAATAACLGLGIAWPTIAAALATFRPDAAHNINRLNVFTRGASLAVLDYAHNEAGLRALIGFGQEMQRQRGGRLLVLLGGPGDRPDEQIRHAGEIAGTAADRLLLHEEERYLRGRSLGETTALYRAGAQAAGMTPNQIDVFSDERAALDAALDQMQPGDVVVAAAHAQRDAMIARLRQWADQTA